MAEKKVPWEAVYPTMATGDLMLSEGFSEGDWIIKKATSGQFSHAGMITRATPNDPALYWEESMIARATDPLRGKEHDGAQLGDLLKIAQLMIKNGMQVYYVKLDWSRPTDIESRMAKIFSVVDGHMPFSYGKHGETMVWDYLEGHYLHILDHGTSMFCSELVAATLQELGLLPDEPPPNGYSPSAFTPELKLADSAVFGEPVQLEVPLAGIAV